MSAQEEVALLLALLAEMEIFIGKMTTGASISSDDESGFAVCVNTLKQQFNSNLNQQTLAEMLSAAQGFCNTADDLHRPLGVRILAMFILMEQAAKGLTT